AADEQVEGLVRASKLDVTTQRDRVVALRERIEKLVEADRPARGVAVGEIFALEHLGQREMCRLTDDVLEGQLRQPRRIEIDPRSAHVQDLAELRAVRLRVGANLLPRERLARLRAPRGITDHAGEVADDDDDLVAEVLEVAQLLQDDRVPEVQVGRRGIEAELDQERAPGPRRALELPAQLGLDDDLGGPAPDAGHLDVDRGTGLAHVGIIAIHGRSAESETAVQASEAPASL